MTTAKGRFYFVEDVMRITGLSRSKSYQIIQRLNGELAADGYITIAGRIPRKKFDERFYCGAAEEAAREKPKNKGMRLEARTA